MMRRVFLVLACVLLAVGACSRKDSPEADNIGEPSLDSSLSGLTFQASEEDPLILLGGETYFLAAETMIFDPPAGCDCDFAPPPSSPDQAVTDTQGRELGVGLWTDSLDIDLATDLMWLVSWTGTTNDGPPVGEVVSALRMSPSDGQNRYDTFCFVGPFGDDGLPRAHAVAVVDAVSGAIDRAWSVSQDGFVQTSDTATVVCE